MCLKEWLLPLRGPGQACGLRLGSWGRPGAQPAWGLARADSAVGPGPWELVWAEWRCCPPSPVGGGQDAASDLAALCAQLRAAGSFQPREQWIPCCWQRPGVESSCRWTGTRRSPCSPLVGFSGTGVRLEPHVALEWSSACPWGALATGTRRPASAGLGSCPSGGDLELSTGREVELECMALGGQSVARSWELGHQLGGIGEPLCPQALSVVIEPHCRNLKT